MHSALQLFFLVASIVTAGNAFAANFTFDLIPRKATTLPNHVVEAMPSMQHRRTSLINRFDLDNYHNHSNPVPDPQVYPYGGEHLMRIGIGTPPVEFFAIADTGSYLIWAQCKPCPSCYNQTEALFDPKESKTYRTIPCSSTKYCEELVGVQENCNARASSSAQLNPCTYNNGYMGGVSIKGDLATERITISSRSGHNFSLDMLFGCGHNDTGPAPERAMGVIGLGDGPLSFVWQVATLAGGKMMSQCLLPYGSDPNLSGQISFGLAATVAGNDVVSIPMDYPYVAKLIGVSVDRKYLPFNITLQSKGGYMLFDTGTPETYVPQDLYGRLVIELRKQVNAIEIEGGQLCYRRNENLGGPNLTFHFEGGANMVLTPLQTFFSWVPGIFCLAVSSFGDTVDGIFGNIAQSNFLIGYDLPAKKISLKPTDCTRN